MHPTVKATTGPARDGRHDPPNAGPEQRDAHRIDSTHPKTGDINIDVNPRRPTSTATGIPARRSPGDAPTPWRGRARRVCAATVLAALAVIWVVWFRPQALDGPVSYVQATTPAMNPTIANGDIVAAVPQPSYHPGDIILYRVRAARPGRTVYAIERIVYGTGATGFVVKADNLPAPDGFHPRTADIVGKVWFHYRYSLLLPLCLTVAGIAVMLTIASWPRRRKTTPHLRCLIQSDQLPASRKALG